MKFYYNDITLDVPDGIYFPAEDSELLAGVIETRDMKGKKVLDMGTGSGFLAILMAKNMAAVTAADFDIKCAKNNAEKNNTGVKFVRSDMFEKINGIYDLVVFNPPYLPAERNAVYMDLDGGETGRDVIERFAAGAKAHMERNGEILIVFSSITGENGVRKIFRNNGFKTRICKRGKIDWEELIVMKAEIL